MGRSPIIYSILICILLPLVFTFELWNGTQSRLNVNDNFQNERNRESSPRNCVCGIENVRETQRISGGSAVNPPHRYPWVVALVRRKHNRDDFYCGGALISRHYVLTAAHCFENQTIRNTRVALGAHDSSTSPEPVQISLMLDHPQYRDDSFLYDVGLVKLQTPAQLGPNVNVLCLTDFSDIGQPDQMATVAGWGYHTYPGGEKFRELQEVDLRIHSFDRCSQYIPQIHRTQICAGGRGKSSCMGDSGGPLFLKQDGKWYGVAVFAWNADCGRIPGTYTRITEYLPWIERETRDSPPCIVEKEEETQPYLDSCGIPNEMESERIAGGSKAAPFEFPWMAIIEYSGLFLGSGALISPKFVLTAASLFQDWMLTELYEITVILGKYKINVESEPHEKRFDVRHIYIHTRYNVPTIHNNDLALIRLKKAADIQYRPICLPQPNDQNAANTVLTIAGWGFTRAGSPLSNFLRKADMNVLSYGVCKDKYPEWFTRRMICVRNAEVDACKVKRRKSKHCKIRNQILSSQGDGGAPLMQKHEGKYYLAGVASWNRTQGCQASGDPRVLAAVRKSLTWISNTAELDVA
ncbi:polyserase-2 [Trichonephila clavata]|uniref:Polyserase-2 n=1 Tax=Trichonephila clavata TaxID=2740835 RepID=A0A8X6LK78_TRICU|nr:polyserase-2 [Trichonephila clavata]